MDEEPIYTVDLGIEEVRALLYSVETGIERWAGGDAEDQERLFFLRDQLRAMTFDYTFHNL